MRHVSATWRISWFVPVLLEPPSRPGNSREKVRSFLSFSIRRSYFDSTASNSADYPEKSWKCVEQSRRLSSQSARVVLQIIFGTYMVRSDTQTCLGWRMVLRSDQELFSGLFPDLFRGVSRGMVTSPNDKQIRARVGPTGLAFDQDPISIRTRRMSTRTGSRLSSEPGNSLDEK